MKSGQKCGKRKAVHPLLSARLRSSDANNFAAGPFQLTGV